MPIDGEERMAAALKPFGWTCTGDFWQRYYNDPWVFSLANAVESLSEKPEPDFLVCPCLVTKLQVRHNPATGRAIIMCIDHATSHDDGIGFDVWELEDC